MLDNTRLIFQSKNIRLGGGRGVGGRAPLGGDGPGRLSGAGPSGNVGG